MLFESATYAKMADAKDLNTTRLPIKTESGQDKLSLVLQEAFDLIARFLDFNALKALVRTDWAFIRRICLLPTSCTWASNLSGLVTKVRELLFKEPRLTNEAYCSLLQMQKRFPPMKIFPTSTIQAFEFAGYRHNLDTVAARMPNLRELFVYSVRSHDLHSKPFQVGIAALTGLRCLNFAFSVPITDVTLLSLSSLKLLERVTLGNCTELSKSSLIHLTAFPRLKQLTLSISYKLHGIDAIDLNILNCLRLQSLSVRFHSQVGSAALSLLNIHIEKLKFINCQGPDLATSPPLPVRPALRHLAVRVSKPLSDKVLSHLDAFPALTHLELPWSYLNDSHLLQISAISTLTFLNFAQCYAISARGIKQLHTLSDLKVLNLANCNLTDHTLSDIGTFTSLINLDLSNCPAITDVGLVNLRGLRLEQLILDGCFHPTHRSLDLLATEVTTLTLLRLKNALNPKCDLFGAYPLPKRDK